MNSKKFFDWCRTAVSSIKHWPQKDEIQKDLYGRLEDRYAAFLEKGYTGEESEDKALAAMGDPQEVAAQLAKTYKPVWPKLLVATRIILAIALVAGFFIVETRLNVLSITPSVDAFNRSVDQKEALLWVEDKVQNITGDYICTVERAYYKKEEVHESGCMVFSGATHTLYVEMTVEHPQMWLMEPLFLWDIWAVDDKGRYYKPACESDRLGERNVNTITTNQTGLFKKTYTFEIDLVYLLDLDWIELHYERSGRDLVWRIDLSGGDKS